MANASTGFWAALGAVVGGVAGAAAGHYAEQYRPRVRYANAGGWRAHPAPSGGGGRRSRGDVTEDAMVIGGAVGATVGAFLGGTLAGNDPAPQLPPPVR